MEQASSGYGGHGHGHRMKQDPMYSCHVHLLAFDFLSLELNSGNLFSRRGRPVYRVEVLGVVVSVDRKENFLRFVIDDGTGCIPCILWLNFFSFGRSLPPHRAVETEVRAELGFQDASKVRLGSLLRVQGRLSSFSNHIQVTVSSLQVEVNPNAEISHWLDCMRLAMRHYDLPAHCASKKMIGS